MTAILSESSCPEDENATTCLLRAVLSNLQETSATYDWDPVTFAFTVLIGIFALMFTLISTFQGILVAGPGRRKSSKGAIGLWSTRTKKVWDFHELRRVSIAKTPVLELGGLSDELSELLKRAKDTNENLIVRHGFKNDDASAATWLSFLKHLGLDDFLEFRWKTTLADFLPDDLNAVPAYAETLCIIALAAAAGAKMVYNEGSLYPIMIGEDFQLDFRQHPGLGVVAAFSRYSTDKPRISPSVGVLIAALQNAVGRVEFRDLLDSRGVVRWCPLLSTWEPKDPSFFQRLADTHDFHHPQEQGAPDQFHLVQAESRAENPFFPEEREASGTLSRAQSLCTLWHVERLPLKENCVLLWLLEGDRPDAVPPIFPSEIAQLAQHMELLALQSSFWTVAKLSTLSTIDIKVFANRKLTGLGLSAVQRDHYERRQDLDLRFWEIYREFLYRDDNSYILSPALIKSSSRLLQNSADFTDWTSNLSDSEASEFRHCIFLQLKEVDSWLLRQSQKLVACAKCGLALLATTLATIDRSLSAGQCKLREKELEVFEWDITWNPAWLRQIELQTLIGKHQSLLQSLCRISTHPDKAGPMGRAVLNVFSSCKWASEVAMEDGDWYDQLEQSIEAPSPTQSAMAASLLRKQPPPHELSPDSIKNWTDARCEFMREKRRRKSDSRRVWAEEDETEEDYIKNMLIWRAILMAMLFMTATDNTRVLKSGIGKHIIPII